MNLERKGGLLRALYSERDLVALDAGGNGLTQARALGELRLRHLLQLANAAHGLTNGKVREEPIGEPVGATYPELAAKFEFG